MQPVALTEAQLRRLERLANDAGRTPQAMMRFVLRDGFAYTETAVRRAKQGIADSRQGRIITHSCMAKEMRALIAKHGRRGKKAA